MLKKLFLNQASIVVVFFINKFKDIEIKFKYQTFVIDICILIPIFYEIQKYGMTFSHLDPTKNQDIMKSRLQLSLGNWNQSKKRTLRYNKHKHRKEWFTGAVWILVIDLK